MKRPNILIFMTDQQQACSVLPGHQYKAITPALDEFRKDSITFRRAYGPSPHCCPARATFHTGLMPSQHGVWHNVCVANAISRGLKEHVQPWSVELKNSGYRMFYSGKWHVSNYQQPCDYGWEHVFPESMCHGKGKSLDEQEQDAVQREQRILKNQTVHRSADLRMPGEIIREGYPPYIHYGTSENPFLKSYFRDGDDENPFSDKTVVDAALTQLDGLSGDDPWCMFVGTLGPHDPYIPPKRFLDLYKDIDFQLPDTFHDLMEDKPALYRRTRDRFNQLSKEEHCDAIRHYLAFCSYEDWLFGNVIKKLKERGEYEKTMIVYLSDHGDYLGEHGLWCKGLPSFLSAYHIPAIVKIPGYAGGIVSDELISLADFAPTIMDVASVKSTIPFAGQSLLPLMTGEPVNAWRDALFFQSNGNETYGIQRSVVTDRWRFVFNGFDYDELYDLEKDPGQLKNLAKQSEYKPVINEMYRRIWEFGLNHGEQHLNEYIMTALADCGPGEVL